MANVHLENNRYNKFSYMYSCDLEENVQIKIGTLEGERPRPSFRELINDPLLRYSGACQDGCSDLYVTCQIFSDGAPLTLPIQTAYKPFYSRWSWNEWLSIPIKFSDLPRHAILAFTIWDVYKPNQPLAIGGTTISLFGKNGALRQGLLDLQIWPNVEADGRGISTPGRTSSHSSQMNRLAKLTKKYRNGQMPKVDWLDRLTFREIELINEQEKRASQCMYLMVEFPQIFYAGQKYTLVYFEKEGDKPCSVERETEICTIADPEIGLENLVESKHHKLARSIRSGVTDKDLKPVHDVRDKLNKLMNYPPTKALTLEEQDLVWKFRFYLKNDKKGLAKFLKCVNWEQSTEARQALQLLSQWQPMDVEDALELLSSQFSHPAVRRYAIARLQQASNEDLLLYLLQLVQALRYENFGEIETACQDIPRKGSFDQSSCERDRSGSAVDVHSRSDVSYTDVEDLDEAITNSPFNCDLATFLISRACANDALCNFFYWYVFVEQEDQSSNGKDDQVGKMYSTVLKRFSQSLTRGSKEYKQRRNMLTRQKVLVAKIANIMRTVAKESGNRQKKIERLQMMLSDPDQELMSFDPLPLPLDPSVHVKGIIPEKATLFKSSLMPARLHFLTSDDQEYITIFKHGDDLRQDQLILQTITLMDKLLQKEKMDLKLTPYRVLATSNKHGFVQFIDSIPVAEVLKTEDTIQNFFRKHAPSENSPYGICPEVMDNYCRSCAGYCVITYLLGVGDRHLDNLLLTKKGNLFHIDFGYILGRDPKPYPPPMKLSKEMVEAMGGPTSEHYILFRKCSITAFTNLRRHANLFLNLFSLMVDANIPDIALEPDKTVKKIQEKLKLDMRDDEVPTYFFNLVDSSVSAVMAVFVEKLHSIAQYWKR